MKRRSRRLELHVALAGASLILALLTLVWKDWIEIVFRVDPDGGSGALEWLLVAVLAGAAVAFGALAGLEWRRLRAATA